jgi:cobalt-precorrin 5A hydrolase
MKIACFSFTEEGKRLGKKIQNMSVQRKDKSNYVIKHYHNDEIKGGIKNLLQYAVREYEGLIFISATGIAVRMMSPYIKDKIIDPAVVVIDDLGKFSISLLSGHIGGGNELARWLGKLIGAMPVITTASDNRGIESIDVFAIKNNYHMEDMDSIKTITSMMVNGKKIGFYSEMGEIIDYDNLIILEDLYYIGPNIDGLIIVSSQNIKSRISKIPYTVLRPKNINIGIGSRRGVESVRVIEAIEKAFDKINLSTKSIKAMGTIEVKRGEVGIIKAAKHFNCPLKIFTINEIKRIEENFEKSQFVKDTIGVYSVSEPVAYLLGGKLITKKSKYDGITISISKEEGEKHG